MTENEINITDMIKALQCIASQDADGDCYCDHFNAHLTCEQFGDNTRLDEKHMSCGGVLKDTQSCPYSQKTYGVCYEDGELWWLKDVVSILTEIQKYRAIGTIEEIKDLKEKNEKQLEAIKLLTIAAICYEKNLDIIRKEMKENKELVTLYCKLPTVQYIKNTIALSKLADSDIDVNNIESIDEIIRIFDWQ